MLTLIASSDRPWAPSGACTDTDPDVFFDKTRVAEAKAVCGPCPVKGKCREYALTGEDHPDSGVWGGMTWEERVVWEGRRIGASDRYLKAKIRRGLRRAPTADLFEEVDCAS